MASEWYVRESESESESGQRGPISFVELASLLADGSLGPESRVRNAAGGKWQSLDSVIGIRRAASAVRAGAVGAGGQEPCAVHEPGEVVAEPVEANSAAAVGPRVSIWRTAILCVVIGGLAWVAESIWYESRRFPLPASERDAPVMWPVPLLGEVTTFGLALLIVDAVVVASVAGWLVYLALGSRRNGKPES